MNKTKDLVFDDPQKRKTENHRTFGTLPFARHTNQGFAKVKEPNPPILKKTIEINSIFIEIIARTS